MGFTLTSKISNFLANFNQKRLFTKNIQWEKNLERGIQKIKKENKPGMLVIHRTWCESCRKVKRKLNEIQEFSEKSSGLVCISIADDDEPKNLKYAPDGAYVPRVLFLDNKGDVLESVYAENKEELRYFYSEKDVSILLKNMGRVIKMFSN